MNEVPLHTKTALEQGIMRFPSDGEVIIGRRGTPKRYFVQKALKDQAIWLQLDWD